jgi:hypothetical protein
MTDSDNELEDLLASINEPIRQTTKEKKRIADSERYKRLKKKDTTRKYEHGAAAKDAIVLEMAKGKRRKDMTDEEKIAYRRQKTREHNKRKKTGEEKTPTWAKDAEILERIKGKKPREMTAEEKRVYLNAKRRDSYNKSIGKEIVEPQEQYEQRMPPGAGILDVTDLTDI